MEDQVREAQPVAYGVFAFVDGAWWLQFPVYESEAAAHESYAMYAPGSALLTKPLYDAPAATASHVAEVEAMRDLLQKARLQLPLAAASWNEEPEYKCHVDAVLALIGDIDAALKGDKP